MTTEFEGLSEAAKHQKAILDAIPPDLIPPDPPGFPTPDPAAAEPQGESRVKEQTFTGPDGSQVHVSEISSSSESQTDLLKEIRDYILLKLVDDLYEKFTQG